MHAKKLISQWDKSAAATDIPCPDHDKPTDGF